MWKASGAAVHSWHAAEENRAGMKEDVLVCQDTGTLWQVLVVEGCRGGFCEGEKSEKM